MRSLSCRRSLGFTLIELMITVAIVAILTRIAYASYIESVNRAKRAQAQTAIISAAQAMERYFTKNNSYLNATISSPSVATDVYPSAVPATGTQFYTLSLSNQTATSYTITATRKTGSAMANDACGDFTFAASGAKGLANASKAVADCWK